MQVELRANYALILSNEDVRLITLALAGKLHESDRQAALSLNLSICNSRLKQLTQAAEVSAKAFDGAKALLPDVPLVE